MHKILSLLFFFVAINTVTLAQLPSYRLPKPAGWESETFPLPPEFAPEISFKGTEDIRFAPGWSKSASEQYWSYVFIWLVEANQSLTENLLADYMSAYYKGIYTVNLKDKPAPKPGFTTSRFRKIQTATGDSQTYEGSVQTLNYLNHQPLALNVRVHFRSLGKVSATVMLFEISPQPFSHTVWKDLKDVVSGFTINP